MLKVDNIIPLWKAVVPNTSFVKVSFKCIISRIDIYPANLRLNQKPVFALRITVVNEIVSPRELCLSLTSYLFCLTFMFSGGCGGGFSLPFPLNSVGFI